MITNLTAKALQKLILFYWSPTYISETNEVNIETFEFLHEGIANIYFVEGKSENIITTITVPNKQLNEDSVKSRVARLRISGIKKGAVWFKFPELNDDLQISEQFLSNINEYVVILHNSDKSECYGLRKSKFEKIISNGKSFMLNTGCGTFFYDKKSNKFIIKNGASPMIFFLNNKDSGFKFLAINSEISKSIFYYLKHVSIKYQSVKGFTSIKQSKISI